MSVAMVLLVVLLGISTLELWIFIPRGFHTTRELWIDIHRWGGLALYVVVIIHTVIHWRWLLRMTRSHISHALALRHKAFIFSLALVLAFMVSLPWTLPAFSDESSKPGIPLQNNGSFTLPQPQAGTKPTGIAEVDIAGIGEFSFDASSVETLRPDVFQPGDLPP